MALLRCVNNRVALVARECITIYELNERNYVSHRLQVPPESLAPDESKKTQSEKVSNGADDDECFTCAEFSPCSCSFLAVSRNKDLLVWRRTEEGVWQLTLRRRLARKCVQIRMLRSCDQVLAADRAGDVYGVRIGEPDAPADLLLGRLSMALDLVVDEEERHLIVCDRDEKIQVSRFPNCYNIAAFCLGHTQFVSSMALLRPDLLVSGSGDGSLRVWQYATGTELARVDLARWVAPPNAERPPAVSELRSWPADGTVACLVDGVSQVLLFRVTREDGAASCRLLQKLETGGEPWDASFDEDGRLWVLAPRDGERPVQLYVRRTDGETPYERLQTGEPWSSLLEDTRWAGTALKDRRNRPSDTSQLYKQWFDNVQGYLAKKRVREEGRAAREKRARLH